METKEIRQLVKSLICGHDTEPVYLWGPPGTGKLYLLKKTAEEEGINLINLQPAGPLELLAGGINNFFPSLPLTENRGIILIDLGGMKMHINYRQIFLPLIPLILERRSGRYNLPAGWRIILVGNDPPEKFFTEFLQVTSVINRWPLREVKVN